MFSGLLLIVFWSLQRKDASWCFLIGIYDFHVIHHGRKSGYDLTYVVPKDLSNDILFQIKPSMDLSGSMDLEAQLNPCNGILSHNTAFCYPHTTLPAGIIRKFIADILFPNSPHIHPNVGRCFSVPSLTQLCVFFWISCSSTECALSKLARIFSFLVQTHQFFFRVHAVQGFPNWKFHNWKTPEISPSMLLVPKSALGSAERFHVSPCGNIITSRWSHGTSRNWRFPAFTVLFRMISVEFFQVWNVSRMANSMGSHFPLCLDTLKDPGYHKNTFGVDLSIFLYPVFPLWNTPKVIENHERIFPLVKVDRVNSKHWKKHLQSHIRRLFSAQRLKRKFL